MVDVLLKDNRILRFESVAGMDKEDLDFSVLQLHSYTETDLDWLKTKYELDLSIMAHFEDIEISSHLYETENQVAFHFSMPYYNAEGRMIEEPVFFILSSNRIFFFTSTVLDKYLTDIYANKLLDTKRLEIQGDAEIYKFPFEFISDYYADITEVLAKKIMTLAGKILIDNVSTSDTMNLITRYSFNNLLLKEALNEAIRIFNLCKKTQFGKTDMIKETMNAELDDMMVVSDYIQFNLERLRDLKDHINNKIDVEQNRIFKILTVVTVCIALPTLVAGIYGMNFEQMPELSSPWGYPLALLAMVLCAAFPYFYFKRKKWL